MKHQPRQHSAVTLVEVVVVLATLTVAVTFLTPAMRWNDEQARVATCLQNLRTIAQGAAGYITEHETMVFAFPFGYRAGDYQQNFGLATEFIWGGGVPDRRAMQWNDALGMNPAQVSTDTYCIVPADRPLNDYLVPGVWWSHPLRYRGRPERYQIPMELPDFFKCPSDKPAMVPPDEWDPNLPTDPEYATWIWWGTSYACNWYWAYYYYYSQGGDLMDVLAGDLDGDPPGMGPALLAQKSDRGASEFVLFMENQMNFALEGAIPRQGNVGSRSVPGWHLQENMHAAAFLDGSARYQMFDTTHIDDVGWSTWPNRPWDTPWDP